MLRPAAKASYGSTFQACFNPLPVLNPYSEPTGMYVVGPTFLADRFLGLRSQRKAMATRGLDQMNSRSVQYQ